MKRRTADKAPAQTGPKRKAVKHKTPLQSHYPQIDRANPDHTEWQQHKKWTFLYYGALSDSLSFLEKRELMNIQAIGSDENTHIILQVAQEYGDCKIYYIVKDEQGSQNQVLTSPVLKCCSSKTDMSVAPTLKDFLVWSINHYSSDYVALIIGSHETESENKFSDDEDAHIISPPEIHKALKETQEITGKKVDVLGFERYLSARTEIAYELKDVVNYMIAFEEPQEQVRWSYSQAIHSLQSALKQNVNMIPEEFVKKIIRTNTTEIPHISSAMLALDMSKMEQLAGSLNSLANALLNTNAPREKLKILTTNATDFSGFKDSYQFCEKIINAGYITDEKLKVEALKVMTDLRETIIAKQHSFSYPNTHKLKIQTDSANDIIGTDFKF